MNQRIDEQEECIPRLRPNCTKIVINWGIDWLFIQSAAWCQL